MKTLIVSIAIMIALQMNTPISWSAENWPIVKNDNRVIFLSDPATKSITFRILGEDGKAKYIFEAYLNAHEFASPSSEYIYSGDFECVLTQLYDNADYINLFTYSKVQERSWENRGRFLISELINSKLPIVWGRERHFLLRRMEITIKILDYKVASKDKRPYWSEKGRPRLEWLKFEVNVQKSNSNNEVDIVEPYEN